MDNINFNQYRGTYSFYSLKEVPWHGLGQIVEEANDPYEVMMKANLDYKVAIGTIQVDTLNGQPFAVNPYDRYQNVPNAYATYRSDTGEVFGVVGSRYEPVQNEVAIDFIYQVLKNNSVINEKDVIIQTAGSLGKGERIFVTAKIPSYTIGKDDIDRYILFTTAHDGSGSIQAAFTNIRVVCNNTLNFALENCTNKITFKHTKNVLNNLSIGAKMMHEVIKYSDTSKEILELSQRKGNFTASDVYNFVMKLIFNSNQIEYVNSKNGILNIRQGDETISTRSLNKFWEIVNYIDKGVGQNVYRGTCYWLYNGITSYINNGVKYKNNEDKLDNITMGTGFKLSSLAFSEMNKLLKVA